MWNPRVYQEEEDDSWEVRAFAEDTNNIMGTTWPPRSYTCTFCRREFRSAQALGGHMNVHRRDRARLHHPPPFNPTTTTSPSFINIPPHDLVANGGMCFLSHFPNPSTNSTAPLFSTPLNACAKSSPSNTLLNGSSYPPNSLSQRSVHNIVEDTAQIKGIHKPFSSLERICEERNIREAMSTYSNSFDFTMAQVSSNDFSSSFYRSSRNVEEPTTSSTNQDHHEELDLELSCLIGEYFSS
ncbi:unnamed protein product [Lupinus luteus]|uniref:C2H2-type domain-containing protein n=1 Tax=Lupinus luteus TaxID=3873 RepID=A0AAV1WWM0_LUPLU